MSSERWIEVVHWQRFQHYSDRDPPWIKNYLALLHDENYLSLTGHQRAVLHGLWLEYASARCQLPLSTRSLTRRLALRVSRATLEALNHAGFIRFVASKPLALARSREAEAETETEKPFLPSLSNEGLEGLGKELEQWIGQRPTNKP